MTKTAVVAIGGNALSRVGQTGTYAELLANARAMAAAVKDVIDAGWRAVLVHGNGPQVGNLAIQQEATALVPAQPLELLDAMTQGALGSVLARAIDARCGAGTAVPVVTHVVVDPADPAFRSPSKPIGPFFTRRDADRVAAERGWVMGEDPGRGYRRMVPSPEPLEIVEIGAIRALIRAQHLVIAAGGGGIPVVAGPGGYTGVGAVIDKDRAAQLLASALPAQALLLVTAVETVLLDFATARQRPVHRLSVEQARRYQAEGQFPPGSMGPKIGAALRFLERGGEVAVITTPELLTQTLMSPGSRTGTRIEADGRAPAIPAVRTVPS
jgi:carbamate kinase